MMRFFDWIPFGSRERLRPELGATAEGDIRGSYKWLPVISKDYCTGCAQCVQACDHGCLEMVWDFATLKRPADCGSEGNCMDCCPDDVIRMDWVLMFGDNANGRLRTEEVHTNVEPA